MRPRSPAARVAARAAGGPRDPGLPSAAGAAPSARAGLGPNCLWRARTASAAKARRSRRPTPNPASWRTCPDAGHPTPRRERAAPCHILPSPLVDRNKPPSRARRHSRDRAAASARSASRRSGTRAEVRAAPRVPLPARLRLQARRTPRSRSRPTSGDSDSSSDRAPVTRRLLRRPSLSGNPPAPFALAIIALSPPPPRGERHVPERGCRQIGSGSSSPVAGVLAAGHGGRGRRGGHDDEARAR